MKISLAQAGKSQSFLCWDIIYLVLVAIYACLCCVGIVDMSAGGVILDSDLQTYAQGMAGENNPGFFAADPVLKNTTEANSIPNLQRMLASMLSTPDAPQIGLLRAGAVTIFLFYAAWYSLGRMLFKFPAFAASLALLSGVTIWVGWGTFWGITHSDPVPRVFFAAIFPILLALAISGVKKTWLRPLVMLCTGCAMWVHGLNALNCGAMFFLAFLFLKPPDSRPEAHFFNCALCLLLFFAPVMAFLWPSLTQGKNFSQEDLAIFNELFNMRWQRDYSDFWPRLLNTLFNPTSSIFALLAAGFVCWLVDWQKCRGPMQTFCRMYPAFIFALAIVVFFCWAESKFAASLGRVPMGHELVRGLRYLIPLSWIMIMGTFALICGKTTRKLLLGLILCLILLMNNDRQYAAAQYAIYNMTGIILPLSENAAMEKAEAQKYRELMLAVQKIVPAGEPIFSDDEDMAIRYIARRPLAHTFKDGYVFYYNKDAEGSRKWLDYERTLHSTPEGFIRAWEKSGAHWILMHSKNRHLLSGKAAVKYDENGWILAQKY